MKQTPKHISTAFSILLGFVPHTDEAALAGLYAQAAIIKSYEMSKIEHEAQGLHEYRSLTELRLFGSTPLNADVPPAGQLEGQRVERLYMHRCHNGLARFNPSRQAKETNQ